MSLVSVSRSSQRTFPEPEDPLVVDGTRAGLLVIGGVIDSDLHQDGEGFTWTPDGESQRVSGEKQTWPPQAGAGRISFSPNAFASEPSVLVTAEGQALEESQYSGDAANVPIGIVETGSSTSNSGHGVTVTMIDTQTSQPRSCRFHFLAFGVAA